MESNSSISTGAIPKTKFINVQKEIEHKDTLISTYLDALDQEIKSNENEQNKLNNEIKKLHDVIDQLKKVAEQPEWPDSFIQVNALAYVPATIIHTGEHYAKLGPDTYSLMSLRETLGFLQRKLEYVNKVLEVFKEQQTQLKERNTFESKYEPAGTEDMPLEILSDSDNGGVAYKTAAGLYEVLEYCTDEEYYKWKQQNRINKRKQNETIEEHKDDNRLARSDELQKDLRGELEGNVENQDSNLSDISNKNISERVKIILRQSGLYSMLLNDNSIQKYCFENKTALEFKNDTSTTLRNESVLNELIVEALINVPIYTDELSDVLNCGDKSDYDFQEHTTSRNDLLVSDFLDSIENNMKQWSL